MFFFILSICGLINALYLTTVSLFLQNKCTLGTSCHDVLQSDFATFLTIPLSAWGVSFFCIMVYFAAKSLKNDLSLLSYQFIFVSIGSLVSLSLIIVQSFFIKAFCPFCIFSACVVFLMLYHTLKLKKQHAFKFSFNLPFSSFLILYLLFIIPLFIGYKGSDFSRYLNIPHGSKLAMTSALGDYSFIDIDALAGVDKLKLDHKMNQLRNRTIESLLIKTEAKKNNVSKDQYLKNFFSYHYQPTDFEINQKIKEFPNHQNIPKEELIKKVTHQLKQQSRRQRYDQLIKDLKKKYDVKTYIPQISAVDILDNPAGILSVGPQNASIKIIVFSDYLCSHCHHFHETLENYLKEFPEDIHITFRQFPYLSPLSRTLAELSICAYEQNKFLEFSDYVYAHQKTLSLNSVNDVISSLNLSNRAFNACRTSSFPKQWIENDIHETHRLNIQSTPTFFINGYLGSYALFEEEINKLKNKQ